MVCQVRTAITGAAVTGGGLCTMWFTDPDTDSELELALDAVDTFWETLTTNWLDDDVTFTVLGEVNRIAASNGELQQIFSFDDRPPRTGAGGGNAVPRVAQAMIRWRTDEIINGRLLKGRNFIPGIPSTGLTDTGLLQPVIQAGIADAGQQILDDTNSTLVVYHRPVAGAGGSEALVTGVSCWEQFAFLHSRRD